METKEYDVIIVGAGVAGLMLAKLFNNSKLKLLLIENRDTIKIPWNHRYGTTSEVAKKFNLEKYVIKSYKGFEFLYSNIENAHFSYEKDEFCIVDISPFAQDLKLSFEVKTGCTIKDVKREPEMNLVSITDQLGNTYKTKIIIDCSGENKIVSKYLGQIKKGKPIDCYSISLELTNCNMPEMDYFQFFADLKYVNAGMWFYPYSKTGCQFGNYEFLSEYPNEQKQYEKLFKLMENEEPYRTWFKNSKIVEKMLKIGPAATVNVSLVEDNFLACGNAAGAGTPVIGEGFRIALEMAESAYDTTLEAFRKSDFSKRALKKHQQNFQQKFNKYYPWSKIIRFFVLRYFTENEMKLFIRNLKKLSSEEMKSVLKSEITSLHLLKIIDLKLAWYIFCNMFKYYLSGCKSLNKQLV